MMVNIAYTKEQMQWLRDNSSIPRKELTLLFNERFDKNKSVEAIKSICCANKIMTGRKGHFKSGNIPFNKGTKGFMKPNNGTFKKGNRPANSKPIGSTRICSKDGYVMIKVAEPRKWRPLHHVIWEEAHGKIPEGMSLKFIDINKKFKPTLDNLELISKQERLVRNKIKYDKMPIELKETGKLMAKVIVATQSAKQ